MSPKLKVKKGSAAVARERLKGKKVDLRFRCSENPSGVQSVLGIDGSKLQFKCPRCQASLRLDPANTATILNATGKKDSKHSLRQLTDRDTMEGPKPRGKDMVKAKSKSKKTSKKASK